MRENTLRPPWLRADRLLGEWGIPLDTPAGREEFAGRREARRRAEGLGAYEPAGWYLGSEEFRQELLAQVEPQAGPRHTGPEVWDWAQAKAERIVLQELQSLGWDPRHLQARRQGDPRKVRIAIRLRRETTMTLAWIAARLQMGSPGHVNCLLCRQQPEQTQPELLNGPKSENKLF